MQSRFEKRLFRLVMAGFALHLLALGSLIYIRELPPSANVKISSTSHSLIVYGENSLGLFAIRQFCKWEDLEKFLSEKNMKLPQISYAELSHAHNIEIQEKKILWDKGDRQHVILTPDSKSTQKIAEQLKFQGLVGGNFGYSIKVN